MFNKHPTHVKNNRWLFRTEAQHAAMKIDTEELAERSRKIGEWLREHSVTRLPAAFAHFD